MNDHIEKRESCRIDCIRNLSLSFSSYFIEVCDSRTGEVIGRLEDISASGMRLFSGNPIPTNRVFLLTLAVHDEQGAKPVSFEARSIWCNHELDSHFYHTGFRFTSTENTKSNLYESVLDEIQD